MTSHTTTAQLIDYIHGALGPEDDAQVYAHISACEGCRADYRAEVTLSETLRAAARSGMLDFPSTIKANVWQAVRNERPRGLARWGAVLWPVAALPVAAAIALLFSSGGHGLGPAQPSIAATFYLEEHAAHQAEIPLTDRSASQAVQLERTAEFAAAADDLITTDAPSAAAGVDATLR